MILGFRKNVKVDCSKSLAVGYFYKIFNTLTGLALPKNPVTARLMTRRYLQCTAPAPGEGDIARWAFPAMTGFEQNPFSLRNMIPASQHIVFAENGGDG